YVIQARRSAPNRSHEGEFVSVPVMVNGTDVANLIVQTSVGSTISGFFSFDSADPAKVPRRDALEVVPTPVDPDRSPSGGFARADINADWRFTVGGLSGPRRLQVLRTPPGWMMKAIRLDGTDITDAVLPLGAADQSVSGVEVVLTDRVTQVGGTVTDDRG